MALAIVRSRAITDVNSIEPGDQRDVSSESAAQSEGKQLLEKLPPSARIKIEEAIANAESVGVSLVLSKKETRSFSGPIPPPEVLTAYGSETASRIIAMAEKEQDHRHSMQASVIGGTLQTEKRGQVFALVICALIAVGGIVLVANGKEVSGSIFTGITMVGLAYAFISGRRGSKKDAAPKTRDDKSSTDTG